MRECCTRRAEPPRRGWAPRLTVAGKGTGSDRLPGLTRTSVLSLLAGLPEHVHRSHSLLTNVGRPCALSDGSQTAPTDLSTLQSGLPYALPRTGSPWSPTDPTGRTTRDDSLTDHRPRMAVQSWDTLPGLPPCTAMPRGPSEMCRILGYGADQGQREPATTGAAKPAPLDHRLAQERRVTAVPALGGGPTDGGGPPGGLSPVMFLARKAGSYPCGRVLPH